MNIYSIRLTLKIILLYFIRNIIWLFGFLVILFILILLQIKFNIFYSPNSIRIGLVGTYQEHDLPTEVLNLISNSLIMADENGRMKTNLVSGWETNNDATDFKFKLNEGLFWSDSTPLLARDLEFNIPAAEVNATDDQTIQIKLKDSYSPLPSLLTKPVLKKGSLTGVGPYKVKKIEKSRIFITKMVLKTDKRDLPDVVIRFYPNESVAKTGFNLGEVEVLLGISKPDTTLQNSRFGFKSQTDYQKIVTIIYNTKDKVLQNRSLRQALSFQSPKIEGEEETNNPYPKTSWAYLEDAKKYLAKPDDALSALERAKQALNEESFPKELTLTTTPNLEMVAEKIATEWKKLGFDIKIRVESGIPQNFQILLITQSIPQDPDQYFLWHSSQEKTNLSKYSQVRVDKDLEDGRKLIDEEERKAKYHDFQRTLLEDTPATFLYFPKYNIGYFKKAEKLLDKVLSLE